MKLDDYVEQSDTVRTVSMMMFQPVSLSQLTCTTNWNNHLIFI